MNKQYKEKLEEIRRLTAKQNPLYARFIDARSLGVIPKETTWKEYMDYYRNNIEPNSGDE